MKSVEATHGNAGARSVGKFTHKIFALLVLTTGLAGQTVIAGDLPYGDPVENGLSVERLEAAGQQLRKVTQEHGTPGAAMMVVRNGKIVFEDAFGKQDVVRDLPMQKDSIFRIYSMTKAIVSAATLMLMEEGKLNLTDPVHLYIPEFKNQVVAVENDENSKIIRLDPVKRPVTIQDLLRHTSGLTTALFGKSTALKEMYKKRLWGKEFDNKSYAEAAASLPLAFQPGSQWDYGISTDILGRVLEVVSGKPLGQLLEEQLLSPLGMKDTTFFVPAEKRNRVVEGYDPATGTYPTYQLSASLDNIRESAGGGLYSTMMDYAIFCQMILNNGEFDGKRYLGRKTIELMTSNHLGPGVSPGDLYLPGPGHGFGLGFAIRLEDGIAGFLGSKGDLRWGGWAGTSYWIDPKEKMTVLWMIQDLNKANLYRTLFKNLMYQAIVD